MTSNLFASSERALSERYDIFFLTILFTQLEGHTCSKEKRSKTLCDESSFQAEYH